MNIFFTIHFDAWTKNWAKFVLFNPLVDWKNDNNSSVKIKIFYYFIKIK